MHLFYNVDINIEKGCRQDDLIAPSYLLLCAEILSILIKQNNNIKVIFVNDDGHKISQYADDTLLTLDDSPVSLFAALANLDFSFLNYLV